MGKIKPTVIKANVLFDGIGKQKNKYIIIEGDRIIDIVNKKLTADYEGVVTPAFIDAHSHIGMAREGEPSSEEEANDTLEQICPLNDPLNSIYFDDPAFSEAVDFGVLYSCVVPGSGNLIGGKAMIIRNYAENRKNALIKNYGYKMALGFNPRSTGEWNGARPNTRMGIYALLEKEFDNVLIKRAKAELLGAQELQELNKEIRNYKINHTDYKMEKAMIKEECELEFSPKDKAILEMLSGEKIVKVHVHKEDDIYYLIELVNKYGIAVTVDHACDIFHKNIFDDLAKRAIPIVYGPLGSFAYKVELKHDNYKNTKLLIESPAFYGLMTDHPVTKASSLRDALKFFMIQGMKEEDAISIITNNNAVILGISDILGRVENNKIASLIVWDQNPFYLGAFPLLVMGEGKILRKRN